MWGTAEVVVSGIVVIVGMEGGYMYPSGKYRLESEKTIIVMFQVTGLLRRCIVYHVIHPGIVQIAHA